MTNAHDELLGDFRGLTKLTSERISMKGLFAERAYNSVLKRFWGLVGFLSLLVVVDFFFIFPYWVFYGQCANIPEPFPPHGEEVSLTARDKESSLIYVESIAFVNVRRIPELRKWREQYDMAAFVRNAHRYPVPFPWGMRLCYVKRDGSIHYLSDWESRRLAHEYSKIDSRFKFNLMRACLPDVLFYVLLISLAVFSVRRGRRIRRLEGLTRDRLSKLATLCVKEKEERGRFPLSLDELKGVEKWELNDAVTGRPFLCLTSVNDRFLVASPRSWFSCYFPFSFQKRYFVGCADGSVRTLTGSICAKVSEQVFARLVHMAKETAPESNPSCDLTKRADELSTSLDGMTTICRRSLVLFIAFSQALFWFLGQLDWLSLGLLTSKIRITFDCFRLFYCFFPLCLFELPICALWYISLWKTMDLWRVEDPRLSSSTRLAITALVLLNVASLLVIPCFSASVTSPWKAFSWRVA